MRSLDSVIAVLAMVLAFRVSSLAGVLQNGGFEDGTAGWSLNPAAAPAEAAIEIVPGQPDADVHSGSKALRVKGLQGSHLMTTGGRADIEYELTFWARAAGNSTAADGTVTTPKVSVAVYVYGKPEENGGRNVFLCNQLKHNLQPLTSAWREFRLPLKVSEAEITGAKQFSLVFGITGEVVLDDVALAENKSWRAKLLFYLPFDEDLTATVAGGNATPKVRGNVPLVEGRRGKAAAFSDGQHLAFDAAGNFDQAEGTVAMWIRPYWSDNDGVAHCFFEVPGPAEHTSNPDAAFVISKGWLDTNTPQLTYFHVSTAEWIWGQHISHTFGFEPNEWLHLAFSWSASGPFLKVYRNGALVRVAQEPMGKRPPAEGRQIIVGARNWSQCGADAAIDELMVFGKALSDAEVVQVAGVDPATVKPAAAPEPMDSSHVNVLTMGTATAHIPFNRPSALSPVRALFMVGESCGQDVIELAQRCAVEVTAVVTHGARDKFGFDSAYHALWADLSTEAKTKEVSSRLDEKPEALVISGLDFEKIPGGLQQRTLAMVGEGMGLLLVNSESPPPGPTPGTEADRAELLSGVPLAAMSDCYPKDSLSPAQLGERMVQAYTHGTGRVAVIRWYGKPGVYERGMAPRAASGVVDRQYEHRYNYYLSLVGRAVNWVARRQARAVWSGLPQDGQVFPAGEWPVAGLPLRLEWHSPENAEVTLLATLREPAGRITFHDQRAMRLAAGVNELAIPLPLPRAGLNYLDLAVLTAGRVENWATVSFRLERPEEIVALSTGRQHCQRGETVAGEVRFRVPLPKAALLAVNATDTYGREYARTSQLLKAGAERARFSLALTGPTSVASYVEATLVRDDRALAQGETVVYVPKPRDSEFLSMMWTHDTLPDTMVGHRTCQALRAAGFNALYRWSYIGDFRNEAMADLMPVQYCTRLCAQPDGNGWLQLGSLGLNASHGLDDNDHSLANPAIERVLRETIAPVARDSAPLGPWWYSLGDENSVQRGWGYSPYGLEYFRGFLQRRYGTIARLNQEYGADFATFADVPRWRPGTAGNAGTIPALVDHELALDDEWAALHRLLGDDIRKIDATARVGAEGSEAGDMERMLRGVEVWAPYAGQGELLRSLAPPGLLRSHWWGGYGAGDPDAANLWSWLLQGKANFQEYYAATGVDGILNANLTYRDYFKNLLPDLREIDGGLGMLLSGARVISDTDVVIHYSRASFHASAALGELARTAASDRALLSPRAKVLFLPASFCLGEQEARAMAQFVHAGGTLVADTVPGVLNQYGRRLPAGQLDAVFGATCAGASSPRRIEDLLVSGSLWDQPLALGLAVGFCEAALRTTTGRALETAGDVPLMVLNEYGKGRAVLLNFDLGRAPKAMVAQLVEAALAAAGVRPEYRLAGVKGGEVSTAEYSSMVLNTVSVLRRGDVILVGTVLSQDRGEGKVLLSWDTPKHTYNVRTGEYLGQVSSVTLAPLSPTAYGRRAQVYLLALHRDPVKRIAIGGPGAVKRGAALALKIDIDLGKADAANRLLGIAVLDPAGRDVTGLRGFLTLNRAKGRSSVPFAFNDAPGEWTVRVTDLASGVRQDRRIRVR